MKIYFIILAILIFSEEHVLSQVSDSCNLWYGKKNEIAKKADTLKVKVKYMEINENIYFHPYPLSDKDNSFYRKLQEKSIKPPSLPNYFHSTNNLSLHQFT